MQPGEMIIRKLTEAADAGNQKENLNVTITCDDVRVGIEAHDVDRLGIVVTRFIWNREGDMTEGTNSKGTLERQTRFIESNVTYLTERMSMIEYDAFHEKVQLRSSPPTYKDEKADYFEVILDKGCGVSLARHSRNMEDGKVEAVPFVMTSEMLERLVNDISFVLK